MLTLAAAGLIGSALGFGGGLISNLINRDTTKQVNRENIALTREINQQNLDFTRQENEITRAREDNAVQRAAMDMKVAGLSKTLAAGQPASASALSPATMQAPQVQASKWESALQKADLANVFMNMYKVQQDIDTQAALAKKYSEEAKGQALSNGFALENHEADMAMKKSQIQVNDSTVALNAAKTELTKVESENYVRKLDAEIDKILAEVSLTNANRSMVFEKILTEVKSRGLIDKQNEAYVISYMNQKLNYDIGEYNLNYAKMHLKPVNYNYSVNDAAILTLLGSLFRSGFSSGSGF